jgi:hypothetical protein
MAPKAAQVASLEKNGRADPGAVMNRKTLDIGHDTIHTLNYPTLGHILGFADPRVNQLPCPDNKKASPNELAIYLWYRMRDSNPRSLP